MDKKEPALARVDYCRGCTKTESCEARLNQAELLNLNTKRTPQRQKYYECHAIFLDCAAARPPNDKETRRRFGETAIHY